MPSQEKKDKVKQIRKWFDKSDSVLVLRYRGLRVAEANEFRVMVNRNDARLRVLKNTLTKIALDGTDKEGLVPIIDGPVAFIFAGDEPAPVARLVKEYSKGRKEFSLLGGLVAGRVLDAGQVETYAMLPPREVLLARALGGAASPLSGLVGVAAGPIRKLLNVMSAIADTKPAEPPPAEAPAPDVSVTDAESEKADAVAEAEDAKADAVAEAEKAKAEAVSGIPDAAPEAPSGDSDDEAKTEPEAAAGADSETEDRPES